MELTERQVNIRFKKHLWMPLETRGVILSEEQKRETKVKLIAELKKIPNVRSPYGMLVWLIKSERASLLEKHSQFTKKPARNKRNALGEDRSLAGNVFETIGDIYESTTPLG